MPRLTIVVWMLLGVAACGRSSTAPTEQSSFVHVPIVTADVVLVTGRVDVFYPPASSPTIHTTIQWPDDPTGFSSQLVLTILDGSAAIIARVAWTGPLTYSGSIPYSMGTTTNTAPPYLGTVQVRLSEAPCGESCAAVTDTCAPGGLSPTPSQCKPLADLPGPYVSDISRTIVFK
jgi:hypothetical protein